MGKHIAILGGLGSGKTTLMEQLCKRSSFRPFWEEPERRPFQKQLADNLSRWALANQMDFLVFRGEQESQIKNSHAVCIQDGSLDQDFYVFTRYLYRRDLMERQEYELCKRTYELLRRLFSPPDIIIRLLTPKAVAYSRIAVRARRTDSKIIDLEEISKLEALLDDWLKTIDPPHVVFVDAASADYTFSPPIEDIVLAIS